MMSYISWASVPLQNSSNTKGIHKFTPVSFHTGMVLHCMRFHLLARQAGLSFLKPHGGMSGGGLPFSQCTFIPGTGIICFWLPLYTDTIWDTHIHIDHISRIAVRWIKPAILIVKICLKDLINSWICIGHVPESEINFPVTILIQLNNSSDPFTRENNDHWYLSVKTIVMDEQQIYLK